MVGGGPPLLSPAAPEPPRLAPTTTLGAQLGRRGARRFGGLASHSPLVRSAHRPGTAFVPSPDTPGTSASISPGDPGEAVGTARGGRGAGAPADACRAAGSAARPAAAPVTVGQAGADGAVHGRPGDHADAVPPPASAGLPSRRAWRGAARASPRRAGPGTRSGRPPGTHQERDRRRPARRRAGRCCRVRQHRPYSAASAPPGGAPSRSRGAARRGGHWRRGQPARLRGAAPLSGGRWPGSPEVLCPRPVPRWAGEGAVELRGFPRLRRARCGAGCGAQRRRDAWLRRRARKSASSGMPAPRPGRQSS